MGDGLLEQLELLPVESWERHRQPGYVPAGMGEARDQPSADRVGGHDDHGDVGDRVLGRDASRRALGKNDVERKAG